MQSGPDLAALGRKAFGEMTELRDWTASISELQASKALRRHSLLAKSNHLL